MCFKKVSLIGSIIILFLSISLISKGIYAGIIGDINNDGKIGLEEAINALQVIAGIKQITLPDPNALNLFYGFDEEIGTTVTDLSGNNRHGNIYAASRVDGKVGKALLFGNNDARVILDNQGLFENGQVSIEAWIKLNEVELGSRYRIIGGYNYHDYAFQIRNGKLEVLFDGASYLLGNQLLTANVWTHIAFTSNGSVMKTYINGIEDNSVTITFPIYNPLNIRIGANWIYASCPPCADYIDELQGVLDELRIWSVARSSEEILDYYNESK